MAKTGSTSVKVTNWDTLRFVWTAGTQSIVNNSTPVSWQLELVATSSGEINSSVSKDWAISVNGINYSGTNTVGIGNNSTKILASGTTVITHNSDGSKTFSYSFSQEFGITFSGTSIGTKSGSGTGTLDTIPRKSTLTASNGTLGTAQTLSIARADSSFTHTITYICGTASGTITTKTTATSVSFTPPLSLASQNTVGTSVSLSLTLTTYSGSTAIGTDIKHIVCAIPASVKPSISGIVISEANSAVPSGFPYVQRKSQLNVKITASGTYGSTVTAKCVVNGVTYAGTDITTNVLTTAGTVSVVTTVTDSRGRTATRTDKVTVLAYSPPETGIFAVRCDAQGNADDDGEYMIVSYVMDIKALNNKNTAECGIKYKKSTDPNYTTEIISTDYSVSGSDIFPADSGSTYEVIAYATDSFGTVESKTPVPTANVIMHISADGTSVAFGKVAEKANAHEIKKVIYDRFATVVTNGLALYTGSGANAIDPDTALENLIVTNLNTPTTAFYYVYTMFYNDKTENTNKVQIAVPYNQSANCLYHRYKINNTWSEWRQITGETVVTYTNSNANYICKKYSDGTMEISGGMDISEVACNTALGGWYRSAVLTPPTFIQNFAAIPDVCMSFATAAGTGAMVWETSGGSVSVPPTFYLIRPTSSAGVSGRLSIIAKGRWK